MPGISTEQLEALLGKPQSNLSFSLPGVQADILVYPFGQAVVQNGKVVVITIASDPTYTDRNGIRLGMSEDDMLKALRKTHARGHRDTYDVLVGDLVTRTKDYYDDTSHVMYELAAANANDPEAPYHVVGINLANAAGFSFLSALTNAKVSGMYTGQRIDNYTSDPWSA